ncbi:MAG: HAMP domain-containing protein [Clostridiales bacterium]|nr:HAMP domain-containing protein [Clostridiales bacterium]
MPKSLKSQLTSTILAIVLITIIVISFLANIFINRKFTDYVARQQELKIQIIVSSLSEQYSASTEQWDIQYLQAIGMFSLYEGYIIRVYDKGGNTLWDAMSHDMSLCNQIMDKISRRMELEYPRLDGEFVSTDYDLVKDGKAVGMVSISCFGPFFLNENDVNFLHSLNTILIIIALAASLASLLVCHIMAARISRPILKTVDATRQIAEGKYEIRLEEESRIREIKLLEGTINHLAGSLETLERMRKQLTADVAHELRTPISILQSYLEAMTEGIWEATSERLASCQEEVVRIGKLVGDLEQLTRIEADNLKLEKSEVDLRLLIEKTVNAFEAELKDKGLTVTISGASPHLMADNDRLKQVVANLLSNSIKYSDSGKSIYFEIFDAGKSCGFVIRDMGTGIDSEELPFIFERFYRADKSRNRNTGGSGIGLAIVKSIVHAHGGEVTVQSEKNAGSAFTVTLPKK